MTFSDLIDAAFGEILERSSTTTWSTWASHARAFDQLWGQLPLVDISRQRVLAWVASRKREVRAATVLHQLALLRNLFEVARQNGWASDNPACGITVGRTHKRSEWLSEDDEARLKAVFVARRESGELEFTQLRFAILTGLRRGEQAFLRPEHLEGGRTIVVPEGKTGTRLVPLHPEALRIAQVWMRVSQEVGSEFVFWPGAVGCRLKFAQNYASRTVKRLLREAELGHLQWRDLRRTFACRLIQKGASIFEVQKLLGHASPNQTLTYCQVGLDQLRDTVLKL